MARAVFGRGGAQGLAQPWVTPALYFVRNASTGTQQMMGSAIGVPAERSGASIAAAPGTSPRC